MHNNCDKFRITPEFIPRVQNMARFQTDCPVYFIKKQTNKLYANEYNPNRKTKNIF